MKDGYLRGALSPRATQRQMNVLAAFVDYRLITAVIQQLPKEGHWTGRRRERWLATLTSAVDLLFAIDEEGEAAQG